MFPFTLTEAMIRQRSEGQTYERGRDYYDNSAVSDVTLRGQQVIAEVEGSDYDPYLVTITFNAQGLVATDCTCPYDWGGDCKHIVAVLLACLHEGAEVEVKPDAAAILTTLQDEQLRPLLLHLLTHHPQLLDDIEWFQARPVPNAAAAQPQTSTTPQIVTVKTDTYRRQVRGFLRGLERMSRSEAYWQVSSVVNDISELLADVQTQLEQGQGRNALAILEAITEEYVESWYELDDSDGDAGSFFDELSLPWAEAILSSDLTPAEREGWSDRFGTWNTQLADYGVDDPFTAAMYAADEGWDDPSVQRLLQGLPVPAEQDENDEGEFEDEDDFEDDEDEWNDEPELMTDLITARLNILQRQGRTTELLNLARLTGQHLPYLRGLMAQGKIGEALSYTRQNVSQVGIIHQFTQLLMARDEVAAAFDIAEYGLSLPDPMYNNDKVMLATWIRDEAIKANQLNLARQAGEIALRQSPTLANYQALAPLLGKAWDTWKKPFLEGLRRSGKGVSQEKAQIFLLERMDAAAITLANENAYDYHLAELVVDALYARQPDWAVQMARRQAEPIMDGGKSQQYHHALRWVEKAKKAYLSANRRDEWLVYVDELLSKHARKYSLVPGLKGLRG
jgi:uncharacterized Zn finger protein